MTPFFTLPVFSRVSAPLKQKKIIVALLILLFLASRMALILWGYKSIYHPDELEQGSIALDILSGIQAPMPDYQIDTYSGGTLVYGLAAIPFIYFFGITLFGLKMLPFFVSFLTFLFITALMYRFYGFKTAFYAAVLWIFSPPILILTPLITLGSHECLIPAAAFCYSIFLLRTNKKPGVLRYVVAGSLAGFAFYFSYINLIVLVSCAWVTLYHRPVVKPRSAFFMPFACFLGGLLLGLCPWLSYNLLHDFAGARFLVDSSIIPTVSLDAIFRAFQRLGYFFLRDVPSGLLYPQFLALHSFVVNLVVYILASTVFLLDSMRTYIKQCDIKPDGKDSLRDFFRTYLLIYPLFFVFSNYRVYGGVGSVAPWEFRYLVPYYSFAVLYFSTALTQLPFQKTILTIVVALGFFSQIGTIWGKPFGEVFHQLAFQTNPNPAPYQHPPGRIFKDLIDFEKSILALEEKNDSWAQVREIALNSNLWNLAEPEDLVTSILKLESKTHRRFLFRSWLFVSPFDYQTTGATEQFEALAGKTPVLYQKDLILGAGLSLNFGEFDSLAGAVNFIESLNFKDKTMLYFSFGRYLFWQMRTDITPKREWAKTINFIKNLARERKAWVLRGMGSLMYHPFRFRDVLRLNSEIFDPEFLSEARAELEWGIGWSLGERHFDAPARSIEKLDKFTSGMRENALQGLDYFNS